MKKIILSCIISFIIMITSNCSLATTAKVNTTAVRIRESASTESNIITNIYEDDEVEILEETEEWYKVKYGESIGYAKSDFFTKSGETQTNTTTENTMEIDDATLNEAKAQSTISENQVQLEQDLNVNSANAQIANQELKVEETITLSSSIKLRILPSLSTISKDEIVQGKNIKIEKKLGNWYKITGETISGWILETKLNAAIQPVEQQSTLTQEQTSTQPLVQESENIIEEEKVQENNVTETETTRNKTAIVIVETARVRKTASKNGDIIDVLDEDDIVTITGEEGEFYKISSEKIGTGYISKSLVKEKDVTSRSITEERENTVSMEANEAVNQSLSKGTTTSVTGNDIVTFAKQYLGYPYVLGCSTPEKGFDCSGFTRYIYGHFGYTLGQVAANQTSLGDIIERESLKIGDLILFYNDGKTKIGHCGIYIGNGDFIHSANPQRGVVIDNLNTNSYYSQRFVTARRII